MLTRERGAGIQEVRRSRHRSGIELLPESVMYQSLDT